MARGFLGGLVIGGAVSVVGAGVLSVIAFPPSSPNLNTDGPVAEAPKPDVAISSNTPLAVAEPASGALPKPTSVQVNAPTQDSAATIGADVTNSVSSPDTAIPETPVVAPRASTEQGGSIEVAAEDPVSTAPQPASPLAPDQENVAQVSSTPATPTVSEPAPEPEPEPEPESALEAEPTPEPDVEVDVKEEPAPVIVTEVEPAPEPEPEPTLTPEAAPEIVVEAPTEPENVETAQSDANTVTQETPAVEPVVVAPEPDAPVTATEVAPDIVPEGVVEAEANPVPEAPAREPETANAIAPEAISRPKIGKPATNLLERRAANRLPNVGTGDPAEDAAITAPGASDAEADNSADAAPSIPEDAPALVRHAEAFEDPQGRPLLSIILMDSGENLGDGPVGMSALGSFPYALTFAVDVSLPDAQDRMALYRSQGFEVMALVDLPIEATAADTEISLSAALEKVPETIAVMEGPTSGLQASREMSDQVSQIVAASGHGIVWQPKGLDTAQKLAAREGIASQTLFRDFDAAEQTPTVIRRFLDQAAFKAGQQGGVIMVGRLRADTISALLLWGLQDRASRVAVAPVSALLQQSLTR
ncbi:MAG: divergent polysaccharide deacetylase family protein [Aliishimia sp.]